MVKEDEEGQTYPILVLSSVTLQEGASIVSRIGTFIGDVMVVPAELADGIARGIEEGKPISKSLAMVSIIIGDTAVGIVDLTSSVIQSGEMITATISEEMESVSVILGNIGTILGGVVVGISMGVQSFMEAAQGASSSFTFGFSETVSPTVVEDLSTPMPKQKDFIEKYKKWGYQRWYQKGYEIGSKTREMILATSPEKTPSPTELKRIASERMLLLSPEESRGFAAGYEEALKGLITPLSDIPETSQMLRLTAEEVKRSYRIVPRDKIAASLTEMKERARKTKRVSKRRAENIKEINRLSARTGIMLGKLVNTVIPF